VGRRDVDDVYVGVRGEGLVTRVAAQDVPLIRELGRRGFRARPDGENLGLGHGSQAPHELPGNGARPEYPPPELPHDLCALPFPASQGQIHKPRCYTLFEAESNHGSYAGVVVVC
jgi:hypothetical protein